MTDVTNVSGRVLEFDIPGVSIGVAEYEDGPTGCTVFAFEGGVPFAADVRGGSPGIIGAEYGFAHAICFAGGSLLGLEAASGVAAELFERRGHAEVQWADVPVVAGAIIFDFKSTRKSALYPDRELGRQALRAARPGLFPMGPRGAGRMAGVGAVMGFERGEAAGQGGAFKEVGETRIAVFSVVNALGVIVDRDGRVARGNLDRSTGKRSLPTDEVSALAARPEPGNTTLTMLITNQRLAGGALSQLAKQVHASMARCIQPFHTASDGDTLFAVSTRAVDGGPLADPARLGIIASEVAWDAVLASFDP